MLWTYNGLHPIFIYIPIKVQMFFTFWKPYVMFLLNFLPLLHQLSLMWRCHLWYLLPLFPQMFFLWSCDLWYFCSLFWCLYNCWHFKWFHSTPIIFCALTFVLSCSLFTFKLEAPPSSTLFFLLRAFLREFIIAFFLFSSVICITFLVFKTLANGLCGFSF